MTRCPMSPVLQAGVGAAGRGSCQGRRGEIGAALNKGSNALRCLAGNIKNKGEEG
jgi:hypothetical protein